MQSQNTDSRPGGNGSWQTGRRGLLTLAVTCLAVPLLGGGAAAQGGSSIRAPWQAQVAPLPTAEIVVGDQTLTVELATTAESRGRGLGYREGLAPGAGMLFVFSEATERSFWMKGMRFCLDIIWINDGQIQGAAESVCPDPRGTPDSERQSYPSGVEAHYVLEVPGGWLAEHGFGPGTPVEIPAEIRAEA